MKMGNGDRGKRGEMVKREAVPILCRDSFFILLLFYEESHLMCASIILWAAIQAISLTVERSDREAQPLLIINSTQKEISSSLFLFSCVACVFAVT